MAKHLAIFTLEATKDILSGKKRVDGRFSKIKIAPYGKVSAGDIVLMKVSGEEIVGQFKVDRAIYFDHPQKKEAETLINIYVKELAMPESFWLQHEQINFITLIFIKEVTKFLVVPEVPKKDLRPWVLLEA
jgi:hypothetical protein